MARVESVRIRLFNLLLLISVIWKLTFSTGVIWFDFFFFFAFYTRARGSWIMLRLPPRSVSYSLSPEKRTEIMLVLCAIHIQMHFYQLKPQNTKHEAIRRPRGICETKVFFSLCIICFVFNTQITLFAKNLHTKRVTSFLSYTEMSDRLTEQKIN